MREKPSRALDLVGPCSGLLPEKWSSLKYARGAFGGRENEPEEAQA
jgi:hypothetical protein